MDWWTVIKIAWGGIGFVLLGLILVLFWRGRNVIAWNRAIRRELRNLAREAEGASPAREQAIRIIIRMCRDISHSFSPQKTADTKKLHDFIRSIAACYFPQAERPELQISLGQFLESLDASLSRFDQIIHRPGLKRLHAISIKTLHGLYRWSNNLADRFWAKWYLAHHEKIQQLLLIRLFIIPDPFSWALFLSRKLIVLVLLKSLLMDITLFVGKLALDAYDQEGKRPVKENDESIEAVLEDLSQVDLTSAMEYDPEIAAIRRNLVGFASVMLANPTFQDWKIAIRRAARVIARRHFPDSDRPLEEAAIGPLLERTRSLLGTLGKGRQMAVIRHVYKTRIETLFQAKDIGDMVLSPTVRGILKTSSSTYRWIKWPLKIYRRLKRFSLPGLATDIGWVLGKKSAMILIYGRSFDQACLELNWVFASSAAMHTHGAEATATIDQSHLDPASPLHHTHDS